MPVDPSNPDPDSLRVVLYPDPVLRGHARPVEFSDTVRKVAEAMIALMHEHEGIGLAAPQVGLPWRVFVCHVPPGEDRDSSGEEPSANEKPEVFINPVLSLPSKDLVSMEEGCLSLPDIRGKVLRPDAISMTAIGADGVRFTRRASGLLARCWQHEMDHLDGVLIIDRMSQIYRLKNRSAVRDLEARYARRAGR